MTIITYLADVSSFASHGTNTERRYYFIVVIAVHAIVCKFSDDLACHAAMNIE
jgi:hypothetical protein